MGVIFFLFFGTPVFTLHVALGADDDPVTMTRVREAAVAATTLTAANVTATELRPVAVCATRLLALEATLTTLTESLA